MVSYEHNYGYFKLIHLRVYQIDTIHYYFLLGVDKLNEICQLETMDARCRWNSEVVNCNDVSV